MNPFTEEKKARANSNPFSAERKRRGDAAGVVNTIYQYPAGFNEGLSRWVEAPERLVRMGGQILQGRYPNYETAGAPITEAIANAGNPPEPVNALQRTVRRAGEITGESVPYAATFYGGAPVLQNTGRAAVGTTRESIARAQAMLDEGKSVADIARVTSVPARDVLRNSAVALGEGITSTPGRAAVGEITAAAGAGVGSEVARELFPGNETAETIGMLAGGFTPAALTYSPSALATRGANWVTRRLAPSAQREAARLEVSNMLGRELTPDAISRINEGEQLRSQIPGYSPSLAETTGLPSLTATQRQIESQASGEALEALMARRQSNISAVEQYARDNAPGGVADPEYVVDVAARKIKDLKGRIGKEREGLDTLNQLRAGQLPIADLAAEGRGLRAALLDRRKETKFRMAKLADDLGISDTDVSVPFSSFQDEVRQATQRGGVFADRKNIPEVVDRILTFGTKSPDEMRSILREIRYGSGAKPRSLLTFLRSKGGLKDSGGELASRDARFSNLVNNTRGMNLDDAALSATEAGYFPLAGNRASIDDLLEAIDQEIGGTPVYSMYDDDAVQRLRDVAGFQDELDRAGINLNLPDDEIVRRMDFETGTKGPAVVTFNDLMSLRSRVSDDLRDATAAATPSAKKIAVLTDVARRLDDFIERGTAAAERGADQGLAERYAEFRKAYKTEYIDRFNQGAAFKVRAKDGRGYYQVPDERVAEAFFKDVSSARQFKATFGIDAPETEALKSVVLDDLRTSAVRDGEIKKTAFDTWLRRHGPVLNEFPSIKRTVSNLKSATEAISARNAQLTARERRIDNQLLSRELAAIERGGKDAGAIVRDAIADPRRMTQLVRRLRDEPAALEALRRSVWDSVKDAGSDQMAWFIDNNRASLNKILDPAHVRHLETILKATRQIQSVPAPKGRAFEPNPLRGIEDSLGTGLNQIGSRIFAVKSGRTGWRYTALDLMGRFLRGYNKTESARLLEEALYNPQVAKDLSTVVEGKRTPPAVAKRLNAWLFTIGGSHDERPQVPNQ